MTSSRRAISLARKFEDLYKEKTGRQVRLHEPSINERNGDLFFLIREGFQKKLIVTNLSGSRQIETDFEFEKEEKFESEGAIYTCLICPCNYNNAEKLRELFPYTRPRTIGQKPAVGLGDRIGLTTPAHIRAVRKFDIFPVLAQQSIREMERTGRSPQEVFDDVSWAVFQEGYREGFAADADHLKDVDDIVATLDAGFMMFTIDPSNSVDEKAWDYDSKRLQEKFKRLPWEELKCGPEEFLNLYLDRQFKASSLGRTLKFKFEKEALMRTAVKYSAAIAHVKRLHDHLRKLWGGTDFDLEVSVDETEAPTTPSEHFFLASELKRMDVQIRSLAPSFVGKFEKAVDYIGNINRFEETFRDHVLIARSFGYLVSIHSGSDKFSIYPILGEVEGDIIHLKTSGTSYLEALRVVARHDPRLFREIVECALKSFGEDRKIYLVSASSSKLPDPKNVEEGRLEEVYLNKKDGRQVMHVTFGSILKGKDDSGRLFKNRIKEVLMENEEEFYEVVASHLERHLKALGLGR